VFRIIPNSEDKRYISVDVGRFGDDRSVAFVWIGLVVVSCQVYKKLSTTELYTEIQDIMRSHGIHPQNVIVDSDGVGGSISDLLRATNFVNNSSPLHGKNFTNLKSQCYVKLADMFKEGNISLNILEPSIVDDLTQELLAVKLKDMDKVVLVNQKYVPPNYSLREGDVVQIFPPLDGG
jgi:molybdopterin converting factor small subunit